MRVDLNPEKIRTVAGLVMGIMGALLLACSVAWWIKESQWGRFQALTPEQAFADGSFGLELAPLKYLLVIPKLSGSTFEPSGTPWPEKFGFLTRSDAKRSTCVSDAPRNLPVGFSISNNLPGNAAQVPIKFVGLSCAACHAAKIGRAGVILGAGSQTADVIAFTDAFLQATFDPRLSGASILTAYDSQHCPGETTGLRHWFGNKVEAFFIGRWLAGFREHSRMNRSKYDMPFHGPELGDPLAIPTGPSRTRPFRSVVRNALDLPGADSIAYSRVPLVAMQKDRPWSQYDGSVGDPVVRSMVAIFTSGASVSALNTPQVSYNIKQAAEYTLNLGRQPRLPSLRGTFPNVPIPPPDIVSRGRKVYLQQCAGCHGSPFDTGWKMPPNAPVPFITPLDVIGTDPGRLMFRYSDMIPPTLESLLPARKAEDLKAQLALISDEKRKADIVGDFSKADWWSGAKTRFNERSWEFPAGHRLAFGLNRVKLRNGYMNAPIDFAWLRAPYLHNGSVLSLSALIGLTPRETQFCRGDNGYDTETIGLRIVRPRDGKCDGRTPFLFDATRPGNSNAGHDYPAPQTVSQPDLQALLAYLGEL